MDVLILKSDQWALDIDFQNSGSLNLNFGHFSF